MTEVIKGQLTANELIELLTALPPEQRELPVDIEGCDCDGPAFSVTVEGSSTVYIGRGVERYVDGVSVWSKS